MGRRLFITGDDAADALLDADSNALLIGMLLDQQIPLEWAFAGPYKLSGRLGHLDPVRIAAMTEDDFVAVCCEKPAIHRFPASLGRRIRAVCATLTADYGGSAEQLWADAPDGKTLSHRVQALPGFGPEKTQIFIALLAKRFDVGIDGWEAAAGVFADAEPRSIADCADAESLAAVRAWKSAQKAAGKDKQGRPLT